MRRHRRRAAFFATALLAILAIAGCSRGLMTAPETGSPATPTGTADPQAPAPPGGRLAGPSILALGIELPPILPLVTKTWTLVTSKLVRVGEEATVTGARYELQFRRGSLSEDALITITDYDHDILDVELGPHGTRFGDPVLFSIDFTGTAVDPASPWHQDDRQPAIYWLNESTNQWEEIPSTVDWDRHRVEARLEHFSRYVVGTKAGWKGQPNREQD